MYSTLYGYIRSFWQKSTRKLMGTEATMSHVLLFPSPSKNFLQSEHRHLRSRCSALLSVPLKTLYNIQMYHIGFTPLPVDTSLQNTSLWDCPPLERWGTHPRGFVYHWDYVKRAEVFWLLFITSLSRLNDWQCWDLFKTYLQWVLFAGLSVLQ